MVLEYLDFDHSDDADGAGSWDALASVRPVRLPAALREVQSVLAWAHAAFGAPDAGGVELGEWSYALHCSQEGVGDRALAYDAGRKALDHTPLASDSGRCTLSLTVSGSAGFSQALAQAFGLD
ncbi:hypothetical protein [Simplicispira suum]|uniref:Uncharacterized protein n=1 Tax=Simplicispira suum TaxID=2109915 RepID=A0A2S0MWE4_9BURK|nr:hypothetical protein [Simplicispira suum]AVO40209.1 hypothetical protein C6571_01940 [Simplicispira suum]